MYDAMSESATGSDAARYVWRRNLSRILIVLLVLLVTVNMLAAVIPLAPRMPEQFLDPSWMFSINQAQAQGLVFGRDLVFTYGPYGSVLSGQYHPATDFLMLSGALVLGLAWAVVLLGLATGRFKVGIVLLSAALLIFNSPDLMLLGYPFACLIWAVSSVYSSTNSAWPRSLFLVAQIFTFATLGLLPLIKLSSIFLCLQASLMAGGLLLKARHFIQGLLVVISPPVALIGFWLFADQPIGALPSYFMNGSLIIAGYSDAMAVTGVAVMPVGYFLICLAMAGVLLSQWTWPFSQRICLILAFTGFLYIAFKAGFVRHDNHALIAAGAIALAAGLLLMLVRRASSWVTLLAALLLSEHIAGQYVDFSWATSAQLLQERYQSSVRGLTTRALRPDGLHTEFEKALRELRRYYAVPELPGTVDIYSYEQAYLLASTNTWSPRPIMQSYSAYTPELASQNAKHLEGVRAPDSILFKLQTIDGRFPALDDGPSWLGLLSRYEARAVDREFLLLQRREHPLRVRLQSVLQQPLLLGAPMSLGDEARGAIFARLHFEKTLAGRVAEFVLKTSDLTLTVETKGGVIRRFRLISGMAEAGFLLSPLILTTEDFMLLATARGDLLQEQQLKRITVEASEPVLFWEPSVSVELYSISIDDAASLDNLIQPALRVYPSTSLPQSDCLGAINSISRVPTYGPTKWLRVDGWLMADRERGTAADAALIWLREGGDDFLYFTDTERYPRADIAEYLKAPNEGDIGFSAFLDVSRMSGTFEVGLGKEVKGNSERCRSRTKSISITR